MTDSLHLVCPDCGAINRLPRIRLAANPTCGKCHQPLFAGHPLALSDAAFRRHVTHDQIPLLVDFWAAWCGPCKMFAPIFERAAQRLEPRLRLGKVDTEAAPELSGELGIRSIPTLALFHQGREVDRISGALDLGNLTSWVEMQLQDLPA